VSKAENQVIGLAYIYKVLHRCRLNICIK